MNRVGELTAQQNLALNVGGIPLVFEKPAIPIPPCAHAAKTVLRNSQEVKIRLNSDFSRKALIPAVPNGKPVEFSGKTRINPERINGPLLPEPRPFKIFIGVVAKNRTEEQAREEGYQSPGLDIEIWHLILVLFTFWKDRDINDGYQIRPTFNAIWSRLHRDCSRPSPNQSKAFSQLLDRLDQMKMAVHVQGFDPIYTEVVSYDTKETTFNFSEKAMKAIARFSFHPYFVACLLMAEHTQDVRLDVLGSHTSRYVRAAYLWLPAAASKYVHAKVATKPDYANMVVQTSAEFCTKLGVSLPPFERKRLLTQNKCCVLQQLHGRPMLKEGLCLGVHWWETEADLLIGTYCYPDENWKQGETVAHYLEARQPSALLKNFLTGGGTETAYQKLIKNWRLQVIDPYQLSRLTKYGVDRLDDYMGLYKKAHAILGPDLFQDAITALQDGKPTKTAGSLFRGILFTRIREKAEARTAYVSKSL